MIRGIQILGMLFSIVLLILANRKYKLKEFTRKDYLLVLILSLGIFTTSLFPEVGDILLKFFTLKNRWFAIFVFSILLLFAIFFYVLTITKKNQKDIGELIRVLAKAAYYQNTNTEEKLEKTIQIVIPAYNEEENIEKVLKKIPKKINGYKVRTLVVVDGSSDNTTKIVKQLEHLTVSHMLNRGQGDALRTGFDIALEGGADIVVTMDADGQHTPEELEGLVKPILNNEADFVIGSRFLSKNRGDRYVRHEGHIRHIGILFFTKLINLLTGLRLTDCTSGFRAFNSKIMSKLYLTEDKFNAPELIIDAAKKDVRIKEVPVSILKREEGESKKPGLMYGFGLGRTILKTLFREK